MRATASRPPAEKPPTLSVAPWTPATPAPGDRGEGPGPSARAALNAGLAALLLPIPFVGLALVAGLEALALVGVVLPIPLAALAAVLASTALRGPEPDRAGRGTAIAGVVIGIVGVTVWLGVMVAVAGFLEAAGTD